MWVSWTNQFCGCGCLIRGLYSYEYDPNLFNYYLAWRKIGDEQAIEKFVDSATIILTNYIRERSRRIEAFTDVSQIKIEDIEDAISMTFVELLSLNHDEFESNEHLYNRLFVIVRQSIRDLQRRHKRNKSKDIDDYELPSNDSPDGESLDGIIEKYGKGLSKRHIKILKLRADGITLDEISASHKICRERVRQIESRAIEILRDAMGIICPTKPQPPRYQIEYEYNGETLTLIEWAERTGHAPYYLHLLYKEGRLRAMLDKESTRKEYTYEGKIYTDRALATKFKITLEMLQCRMEFLPQSVALTPYYKPTLDEIIASEAKNELFGNAYNEQRYLYSKLADRGKYE
jgi:RNA polymerase sigma factor (sigma-70 family)